MRGGAERVLKVIAEMFPEAPIYTLLYNEAKLGAWFPRERIRTSRMQRIPDHPLLKAISYQLKAPLFNHHLYLSRFPAAVEAWDFSEFDLVISLSSAFAHGIITNGNPKHLCYVHSPARYLWDRTHDVLDRVKKGPLGSLRRRYLEKKFHRLRVWDTETAERPDMLLAASKEVQRRTLLYWRRESNVLYPPLDDFWFQAPLKPETRNQKPKTYLVASTLVPYKRIDLAIEACNKRGLKLRIVGEGPDEALLRKIAGPTVEFRGYKSGKDLRSEFENASAVLFPGEEDFGLVPLEAMSTGTPVIAYARGGALETVVEGKTGVFFHEPTTDALLAAIDRAASVTFDPHILRAQAERFSTDTFRTGLRRAIERLSKNRLTR